MWRVDYYTLAVDKDGYVGKVKQYSDYLVYRIRTSNFV